MKNSFARKIILFAAAAALLIAVIIFFRKSIPYADNPELQSANISIDSVLSVGPAVAIYDSTSRTYYWLKSLTSLDMSRLDTLKTKKASVRYMKFFAGPLENRIFHMEVDSIVVIDQVVE